MATSVNIQVISALTGRAKGVTGNPSLSRNLNGRTFNMGLANVSTTVSTYCNNGVDISTTLGTTLTTVYDLRSFLNVLNEPTQALSTLRLIYVQNQLAVGQPGSILVGNSAATALIPKGCMGTTPVQLEASQFIILETASLAGVTVNATAKDIKVAASGTAAVPYVIGWWGES